ncbi:hypothetical protein P7K49_023660 [Saguinus oedipus]|uniref:Cyclin-like domain-containing protein n=1 Tax=Saguinus oedipus TaxID=9490 RepID=A0ABQ9UME4_SAGOE|nr:hypothetical protein P7K49_023660 [Saguinus oedipus]
MGNILCCCVCPKVSPELDHDEGSGCPPESKICEAAAEDTTAAAPTAAAIEPAELTVEAGEGLPVCDICDGEMPEGKEVMVPSALATPLAAALQDSTLEYNPSDHREAKKSQADDRALESDASEHPEAKKSLAVGETAVFFFTKKKNRALESDPSDDPEAKKSQADDTMSKLAQEIGENSRRNHDGLGHTFSYQESRQVGEYIMYDPSEKMIYRFIHTLFYVKRLKATEAIISAVYIERLLQCAKIYMCRTNWRRIILGAILVVTEVQSNVAVCNKDLCRRFKKLTVNDL